MNKILVSTGWCSFGEPNKNSMASKTQYLPGYLDSVWKPQIEKYIKPDGYFVYSSNCPVRHNLILNNNIFICSKSDPRSRIDYYGSILMSAQYALINGMDWLYIEQDCLVKGLDKVLEFADGKTMCYGYGDVSYTEGWAEQSLMYVTNCFLREFLEVMNILSKSKMLPEPIFHINFKDDFTPWPFGVGRKRPIDFMQPVIYAQQLVDFEISEFIKSK